MWPGGSGAGRSTRLVDRATPRFPDETRLGAWVSGGVEGRIFGRMLALEARTWAFEGDATVGDHPLRWGLTHSAGLAVRVW